LLIVGVIYITLSHFEVNNPSLPVLTMSSFQTDPVDIINPFLGLVVGLKAKYDCEKAKPDLEGLQVAFETRPI
jgi:hypothetical protein